MQKKLYQIAVWGLGIFSGGCNLDLAPENVMVNENVYKNETTAEAALFGAYVRLNSFLPVHLMTRIIMPIRDMFV